MGADGTPEGTYVGMMRHNFTTIAKALGGQVADPEAETPVEKEADQLDEAESNSTGPINPEEGQQADTDNRTEQSNTEQGSTEDSSTEDSSTEAPNESGDSASSEQVTDGDSN